MPVRARTKHLILDEIIRVVRSISKAKPVTKQDVVYAVKRKYRGKSRDSLLHDVNYLVWGWEKKTDAARKLKARYYDGLGLKLVVIERRPRLLFRVVDNHDNPPPQRFQSMAGGDEEWEDVQGREMQAHFSGERVLRNSAVTKQAKRNSGFKCAACDLRFESSDGQLGKDYIEAHHLFPGSQQKETKWKVAVTHIETLCSNCHRMVHRLLRQEPV